MAWVSSSATAAVFSLQPDGQQTELWPELGDASGQAAR